VLNDVAEAVRQLLGLGLNPNDLSAVQMAARAAVVYGGGLLLVHVGQRRFLGRHAAFDTIVAVMLGSVLSRAINGVTGLFETLAAGLTLVILHRLLAVAAFHSHAFGRMLKGSDHELFSDGRIRWDEMRRSRVTERDLYEALRSNGQVADLGQVQEAHLERSGDISVVKRQNGTGAAEVQIVDVPVEAGTRTVRIWIE